MTTINFIEKPTITLIAATALEDVPTPLEKDPRATDSEHLIELAGRGCYKSFHRPNPHTSTNEAYLYSTLFFKKHYSIAEHATATFRIEGVSRSLLAELTRHRHLSFSVESQRFVNYAQGEPVDMVVPPAIVAAGGAAREMFERSAARAVEDYAALLEEISRDESLTRKQRQEAARSLLPNCMAVSMVVSGNLRAWDETLTRRRQLDADAEISQLSEEMWQILHDKVSPAIFA